MISNKSKVSAGIIGSGFGLYGYLPALKNLFDITLFLQEAYKKTLLNRPDIGKFFKEVNWCTSQDEVFNKSELIIIAKRPIDQYNLLKSVANFENKKLILEKPLTQDPKSSLEILDILNSKKIPFRISYTFFYTNWFNKLSNLLASKNKSAITIEWNFKANHFEKNIDTWKRSKKGGGVIDFYGIHLLAILARKGYKFSSSSIYLNNSQEEVAWEAQLDSNKLPKIKIKIDTFSNKKNFLIYSEEKSFLHSDLDPYGDDAKTSQFDRRVTTLEGLIFDFFQNPTVIPSWYEEVIILWEEIRKRSNFYSIQETP